MVGGSIQEVTLDGRTFAVPSDNDSSRNLGGKQNENQPNGNGTTRLVQNTMGWSITGLSLAVSDLNDDQEFIQDLADSKDYFPVSVTYASGAVMQGTGQVLGEVNFSNQSTTVGVDLGGPSKLERQL